MFTGIVEELGHIITLDQEGDSAVMRVHGPLVSSDARPGVSVAVNGVCLTVVQSWHEGLRFDVMGETLERSCLGAVGVGDPVNLERAVAVTGRLGGHIVQGHVDGTGQILQRSPQTRWEVVRISLPGGLERYVVEKGSITVDGVSLTVSAAGPDFFEVCLIPTTLTHTTLGHKQVGDVVNLEVDVLAKYVERLLSVPSREDEAPS